VARRPTEGERWKSCCADLARGQLKEKYGTAGKESSTNLRPLPVELVAAVRKIAEPPKRGIEAAEKAADLQGAREPR